MTPHAPLTRAVRRGYSALLRLLFRATHAPDQRHSERLWPHGTIRRDPQGRIMTFRLYGREIPIENAALTQEAIRQPRTGPVHMIASGPSVAQIDYTALQPSRVMGMNGSIALADRHALRFDYYCITDTGFIRKRPALLAKIVSRDLLLFTTPVCLWHILQYFPAASLACRFFLIERVGQPALLPTYSAAEAVARADGTLTLFDAARGLGYSADIGRGVFPGGTVAYESLQILAWLGFNDIYLHGIDLGNAASTPRFYETSDDTLPTTLHKQLTHEIAPSFRQAAAILRAKGVKVSNLSLISALGDDIFPKRDWHTLLTPTEVSA